MPINQPIHSFVRSFIHSFICYFNHSFTHFLTHSLTHALVHPSVRPPVRPSVRTFVPSFIRSLIQSWTSELFHQTFRDVVLWWAGIYREMSRFSHCYRREKRVKVPKICKNLRVIALEGSDKTEMSSFETKYQTIRPCRVRQPDFNRPESCWDRLSPFYVVGLVVVGLL